MPARSHTRVQLTSNIRALGAEAGDVLFVHSSYKSLGTVDGGAGTVIAALEKAIGAHGLLLMPSFNLIGDRDERAARWDVASTPSSVGWLTEFFRLMPDTLRSDHYSHSVAARGRGAAGFVADHLSMEGMASPWDRPPWGRTYGTKSPMMRAYRRDGKILMLGVDYESSTYVHVVEVMLWNERLRADPEVGYVGLDRVRLGEVWDRVGPEQTGRVGDAWCRLFGIRAFVDCLLETVRSDTDTYDRVKLRARAPSTPG